MDPYDNNVTLVPEPQTGMSRKTIFIIIGIVVALVVSAILLFAANRGNNLLPFEQRLAIRMSNLQKLSTGAQQSITSENLGDLNSQLSALLISDNSSLQADLKALGIDGSKYPKDMVASETDDSTYTALKQAVIDGDFDQKYISAVTKKIDSTTELMNTVYSKSKDSKLRQDISKSYKDLQFTKKQMLKLNLP